MRIYFSYFPPDILVRRVRLIILQPVLVQQDSSRYLTIINVNVIARYILYVIHLESGAAKNND